jgi:hypothetical protein
MSVHKFAFFAKKRDQFGPSVYAKLRTYGNFNHKPSLNTGEWYVKNSH